jgi:predicted membrane-bound spermidine synthase
MAAELLGAKMIAPFFGTSLNVWAGVLSITLLALAGGYYLGGYLTTRYDARKLLIVVLLIAGLTLGLMRFSAPAVMKALTDVSLNVGVLVALFVYLLPPILCFGMVSPIIIHILVNKLAQTGSVAGRVYAVSTVGGVITTLVFGFAIIPEFGISRPTLITGAVVAALPLLVFVKPTTIVSSAVVAGFCLVGTTSTPRPLPGMVTMRMFSEGLMGQVKVGDFGWAKPPYGQFQLRGLFVNNTVQTLMNQQNGVSHLEYVWFVKPLLSAFDADHKALLVGLGGGVIAKAIRERGTHVQVVEIDKRLPGIARDYFGLPADVPVAVDDGRHYLRSSDDTYDLIMFDAFLGENPPWQLLTRECFEEAKAHLNTGGVFLIEFYGFLTGDHGIIGKSVYRTLMESGFKHVDMIATSSTDGIERNLIYVASDTPVNYDSLDYNQTVYGEPITNLEDYLVDPRSLDMSEAILLTDDRPVLDKLLAGPAIQWRESLNAQFRDNFLREGKPLFY